MKQVVLVLCVMWASCHALAGEDYHSQRDSVFFDDNSMIGISLDCDDWKALQPDENDFDLVDFSFLSNRKGDRVALVTVRNRAGGQRIFSEGQVVGLLANCKTLHPFEFRVKVKSGEQVTKRIYFGRQRFPLTGLTLDRN